jgi:hypothetical protein
MLCVFSNVTRPVLVAALLANHLLAMMSVQLDRDLVAHGPAGNKQRRLAPENGGRHGFQTIDGRVLAVHVVADFGFEHGPPHFGRRLGDGVAAQVDASSGKVHG